MSSPRINRQRLRPYLLVLPLVGLVGLGACSSSDSDGAATDQTTTVVSTTVETTSTTVAETTAPPESTAPATTAAPAAPATAAAPPADPGSSELEGFEEYDVLKSNIPDLDSLTPIIETDNPGTRVILYENADGRKVYKSVFVKQKSRLKIIDLGGEGPPIYNDTI